MQLTDGDFHYLAIGLESFFFGLYSGVFILHLLHHASRKGSDNKQNIIFYSLSVLYLLSMVVMALDTVHFVVISFENNISLALHIETAQPVLFGCCDFIAQSILIHRCWIVWSRNIRVVILPSFLAFAFLVTWLASIGSYVFEQGQEVKGVDWGNTLTRTSLTASMTVNALVTGLIVFRIFKVFREVKSINEEEKYVGLTDGTKLRSIIFIIIESGMALWAVQLARLVTATTGLSTDAENGAYAFIASIHQMLNGITPTIILVRVSMGLSFHDKPTLVETVSRSLQFAADRPNATAGSDSIGQDESWRIEPDDPYGIPEIENTSQEARNDDVCGSDDIQLVDR